MNQSCFRRCLFGSPPPKQKIHDLWLVTFNLFLERENCLFATSCWNCRCPWLKLHPGKLTCLLKRNYFIRKYIFQPLIFRGHVSFAGNIYRHDVWFGDRYSNGKLDINIMPQVKSFTTLLVKNTKLRAQKMSDKKMGVKRCNGSSSSQRKTMWHFNIFNQYFTSTLPVV